MSVGPRKWPNMVPGDANMVLKSVVIVLRLKCQLSQLIQFPSSPTSLTLNVFPRVKRTQRPFFLFFCSLWWFDFKWLIAISVSLRGFADVKHPNSTFSEEMMLNTHILAACCCCWLPNDVFNCAAKAFPSTSPFCLSGILPRAHASSTVNPPLSRCQGVYIHPLSQNDREDASWPFFRQQFSSS